MIPSGHGKYLFNYFFVYLFCALFIYSMLSQELDILVLLIGNKFVYIFQNWKTYLNWNVHGKKILF